jgi:hypothetical protein
LWLKSWGVRTLVDARKRAGDDRLGIAVLHKHGRRDASVQGESTERALLWQERLRLEARLQKSLDMLAAVTDDAEAERLLDH